VLAASFPCYKASSYAEVAVCSDSELSRQDEELAVLYQKALVRLPDPKAVQWVQKNWLEDDRDQCHTVQCVKDSYSKRIFGLHRQLGEPIPLTSSRSQGPTIPAPGGPLDEGCANLNAAVKTALNSKIPAASLTQFGGRVVTGWRQSDYDAFLIALNTCSGRAEIAPELNIFPDEARLLLTSLRERAVRIGTTEQTGRAEYGNPTVQPSAIAAEPVAAAASVDASQEAEDWKFVSNANGVVMTSASRNATIFLGKDCDAMSPQYGSGVWSHSNGGWGVKVGSEQFNFPRIVPPIEDAQGNPPQKCEFQAEISPAGQTVAATATPQAPVAQPSTASTPAPVQKPAPAPVVRSAPAALSTSTQVPNPTAAVQQSQPAAAVGNFLAVLLVVWLGVVIVGIVCGFNCAIVVYRNFDDLAIVFFIGVLLFVGGLTGFYFSGFKDSFATPLLWGLTILGTMILFGWTIARTWRDQQPASVWRFALALITKMSLGILFVNNLVTLISPSGKTFGARSQARGSALLFLAVLTPIVMRLVRDHEGVWAPHNLLNVYRRRRVGI
jgi:hypothetical protein